LIGDFDFVGLVDAELVGPEISVPQSQRRFDCIDDNPRQGIWQSHLGVP
jgi:hypothetical protein